MFGRISLIVNTLSVLFCFSVPLILYNFEHSPYGFWPPAFLFMPIFGAFMGLLLFLDTIFATLALNGRSFFINIMTWCISLFIILQMGHVYRLIDYVKIQCCLDLFAGEIHQINPEIKIYDWGEGGMVSMNVFNYLVKLEHASTLDITSLRSAIAATQGERSFSLLFQKDCNSHLVNIGNGFYALTTVC